MNKKLQNTFKRKDGYTLVEMIIVLLLIGILIPTIFSIIFVLIQQQVKIYRLIETKRQGDRIMGYMKEKISREGFLVRSQAGALPAAFRCNTPLSTHTSNGGTDLIFLKGNLPASPTFNFYTAGTNLMARDITVMPDTSLNDTSVRVAGFTIQCFKRSAEAPVIVGFTFTVTFTDTTPTAQEGTTSLRYHTKIKLRH